MASTVPTVKQIAWTSLIPQLLLIGLFIYVFHLLNVGDPIIFGALTYLVLSFGLRNLVAKNHRKGVNLVKQQKFADAIPYFQKSVDYFSKNAWVDKYRFLIILSSSKMSYREMGLCNIAFCYSQTGKGLKAKEFYQQILRDYPENGMATAGLNMLNSLDDKI
ncbi:MAG: hypothetical protein M3R14_09965 [Acidobacteriota bacterium]|nr:hypothetical protein [Acidobacteriota bacterium]